METLTKAIYFFGAYDPWIKLLGVVWVLFTAALISIGFIFAPKQQKEDESDKPASDTANGGIHFNAPILGDFIINQGQTGGIVANTVNVGPVARNLSQIQIDRLTELFNQHPDSRLKIITANTDPEVVRFGARLEKAARSSRIRFEKESALAISSAPTDIQVRIRDRANPPSLALPLANALSEMKLIVRAKERPQGFSESENDLVVVVIGSQAPQ